MKFAPVADELREREGEQCGTNQTGDAAQAASRALELTLLARGNAAAHQSLRGRSGESPKHQHRQAAPKYGARWCEAVNRKTRRAEKQSDHHANALAEARDDGTNESALH